MIFLCDVLTMCTSQRWHRPLPSGHLIIEFYYRTNVLVDHKSLAISSQDIATVTILCMLMHFLDVG